MSEFTELFQLDNLINEVETRYLSKLIILMSDIIPEEKKLLFESILIFYFKNWWISRQKLVTKHNLSKI